MKRTIVPNIKMVKKVLSCKGKSGHWCPLFKKQGSLDGACATYSVIMNLLVIRAINGSDTHWNAEHKSYATKKLFKIFCEDHGMHRGGQTFYKIKKMLLQSFESEVFVEHKVTEDVASIELISKVVKDGLPVVMSITGHAMLAIGIEEDGGKVTKILCLDPSGDYVTGRRRWNAEIDIANGSRGVYTYSSVIEGRPTCERTRLDDVLIISKK